VARTGCPSITDIVVSGAPAGYSYLHKVDGLARNELGEVEMKIFVTTNSALIGVKSGPVMARLRTTTAAIQGSPSLQLFSEDMRRKGASRAD
jgi:hypothetical protein